MTYRQKKKKKKERRKTNTLLIISPDGKEKLKNQKQFYVDADDASTQEPLIKSSKNQNQNLLYR